MHLDISRIWEVKFVAARLESDGGGEASFNIVID
jgi:hypothetical protein